MSGRLASGSGKRQTIRAERVRCFLVRPRKIPDPFPRMNGFRSSSPKERGWKRSSTFYEKFSVFQGLEPFSPNRQSEIFNRQRLNLFVFFCYTFMGCVVLCIFKTYTIDPVVKGFGSREHFNFYT